MNYSISEIANKLALRTEDVAIMLLPAGKRVGSEWVAGDTSGAAGLSCKVHLTGDHVGHWRDWANDTERGDLIDLWQTVRGLSRIQAMREVKNYLGLDDGVKDVREKRYRSPEEQDKLAKVAAKGKIMQYFSTERKIEPSIINLFQIETDKENIVYPSYSIEGALVNRSYVSLKREEGKKKVWQEKGCAPCLWGWHALTPEALNSRQILLCEGQIDCMTWTQWGIPSLSIPNGSGTTWIDYEWENLEMFSQIFLSFDMDGAGKDNLSKVMNRLGKHRCRVVQLPYKDANEALLSGMTAEQAKELVDKSEYPKYTGLAPARQYQDDTVEEFFPNANAPQGFKPLMLQRADGGMEFLPGDVTVWSGISSHGKTTLLSFLTTLFLTEDRGAFIASLEMKPARILARMFKAISKAPMLSKAEIEHCFTMLEGKLFFADKIGYIARKELLDMMLFAYSRYGVEHFVIDSMMRVQGLEEDYPAQGDFLNELQAFAKKSGAHVHLVCHPRKQMTGESTAPGKLDVKGSSLIMNNCDNLIVVHKNMQKEKIRRERKLEEREDREMYDAEVVSEKQRDKGWHGRVLLKFDPRTFVFSKFL